MKRVADDRSVCECVGALLETLWPSYGEILDRVEIEGSKCRRVRPGHESVTGQCRGAAGPGASGPEKSVDGILGGLRWKESFVN